MLSLVEDTQQHCCRFLTIVDRKHLTSTCRTLENVDPVDYHMFPLNALSMQRIFKEWLYVVKPRKRVRGWCARSWQAAPRQLREDILLF
jgi:hypothetical protein